MRTAYLAHLQHLRSMKTNLKQGCHHLLDLRCHLHHSAELQLLEFHQSVDHDGKHMVMALLSLGGDQLQPAILASLPCFDDYCYVCGVRIWTQNGSLWDRCNSRTVKPPSFSNLLTAHAWIRTPATHVSARSKFTRESMSRRPRSRGRTRLGILSGGLRGVFLASPLPGNSSTSTSNAS